MENLPYSRLPPPYSLLTNQFNFHQRRRGSLGPTTYLTNKYGEISTITACKHGLMDLKTDYKVSNEVLKSR